MPEIAFAAAPVITGVDNVANYMENASPVIIDSTITITDSDSSNLNRAIVTITTNFSSSQDSLVYSTINGITGSYNSTTGALTLTGTATKAQYEQALESVKYQNSSEFPNIATRTISFVVRDTTNSSSSTVTTSLTVTAVNDLPVISGVNNVATYVEGTPPVIIDSTITLTDAESTQLNQATVSITANFSSSEDVLIYSTINGITGSYDGGTGVLTLSGVATLAQYEQALESIQYRIMGTSNPHTTPPRTISFVVRDTQNGSSTAAATNVNILVVNDVPNLGDVDNVTNYTEDGTPVIIDSTITISDPDNPEMDWARVSITANLSAFADELVYTPIHGIASTFSSINGVLTLSGVATKAQYEEALESVQYRNTSNNPSTATRTIAFMVRDTNGGTSSTHSGADTTVTVTAVNDAPVVSGADNVANHTENGAPVVIDPAITISDADGGPGLSQATVSITGNFSSTQDQLVYSTVNGITGSYDSEAGVLTLSGTATFAEYEQALESVQYLNSSENPDTAARIVSFVLRDTSDAISPADTTTLTVTAVNDAPEIGGVDNVLNYTENDPATVIDSTITITDVDNTQLNQATVSISSGTDVSELLYSAINGITGSYNSSAGVLTLSGTATLAQYEEALETVQYRNFSESPGAGAITLSFSVRDNGNTSSATDTTTVTVASVNDMPVVSDADNIANYTENGPAVIVDSTLAVSDIDTPMLNEATVSITGNFNSSEDALVYSTLNDVTGSYNSGTGVLTLSGGNPPTLWNYKLAMQSVRYQNSSENPSTATRTISFVVRDVFNGSSAADTTTLTVTAVSDAPVISDIDNVAGYTENDPPVVIDPTITIADIDNTQFNQATVSITGNFNEPEDQLVYSTVNAITGLYDGGTGVLTLSGTATLAQYEQALENVRYQNTAASPDTDARTISFAVRDVANIVSTAVSTTLNVAALPDADSDGVNDSDDLCPGTLSPNQPDANGCAAYQRDTDDDEVSDADDLCPATQPGEIVDNFGCAPSQLDTDSDGVADSNDFCPATTLGQTPDTLGCSSTETDSDQDGINDSYELAMGTDPQDSDSFPIDQNMDGIPDALLSMQGYWESPCNYLGGGQYQKEYLSVAKGMVREFHNSTSADCSGSWSVVRNHYSYTLQGVSSDIGSIIKNQLLELNLVVQRSVLRLNDAAAAGVMNSICSKNDFAVGIENIANGVSCSGGIQYPQPANAHYDILSLTYNTLAPGEDSVALGNLLDRNTPQSRATELATFSFSRVGQ